MTTGFVDRESWRPAEGRRPYWTTLTRQFAVKPTRGQSSRGLVNTRTSQLAGKVGYFRQKQTLITKLNHIPIRNLIECYQRTDSIIYWKSHAYSKFAVKHFGELTIVRELTSPRID